MDTLPFETAVGGPDRLGLQAQLPGRLIRGYAGLPPAGQLVVVPADPAHLLAPETEAIVKIQRHSGLEGQGELVRPVPLPNFRPGEGRAAPDIQPLDGAPRPGQNPADGALLQLQLAGQFLLCLGEPGEDQQHELPLAVGKDGHLGQIPLPVKAALAVGAGSDQLLGLHPLLHPGHAVFDGPGHGGLVHTLLLGNQLHGQAPVIVSVYVESLAVGEPLGPLGQPALQLVHTGAQLHEVPGLHLLPAVAFDIAPAGAGPLEEVKAQGPDVQPPALFLPGLADLRRVQVVDLHLHVPDGRPVGGYFRLQCRPLLEVRLRLPLYLVLLHPGLELGQLGPVFLQGAHPTTISSPAKGALPSRTSSFVSRSQYVRLSIANQVLATIAPSRSYLVTVPTPVAFLRRRRP